MAKKLLTKSFGVPRYLLLFLIVIGYVGMHTGILKTDMASTLFIMFMIGIPLYEIGNRIPIWNKYIGGGIVLTFLVTPLFVHYQLIPKVYAEAIDSFTMDTNFLMLFIIILITGSILSLDRKFLLQSFIGYIPAIVGGIIGAALLGSIIGFFFEVSPQNIILNYVLPIMGGGNGGGAVPLSQMYEDITGLSGDAYYQFSIIILTIANIFAIVAASLLNRLGEVKPQLTGDKKHILRKEGKAVHLEESHYEASLQDVGASLIIALGVYALGMIMSQLILPSILGVKIHNLAYTIIIMVLISAFNIIPYNIREGAKKLQIFFVRYFTVVVMVGVGIELDLKALIEALNIANILISVAIVLGSIIGSGLVGYFVGFYPIDSAVTAGLCMANRGGSGDLAVLGAADRMGLMAYAQLSSRLGGAIVLIMGSILFTSII